MSSVYAGSRVLLALAEKKYAPTWFDFVDKAGRPWRAIAAVLIFFPIAYANVSQTGLSGLRAF